MNNRELLIKHFSVAMRSEYSNGEMHHTKIVKLIANEKLKYSAYTGSPEEIIMEVTRKAMIRHFLHQLLRRISKLQRKHLFAYIRNDYNASQTAEVLEVDEKNIRYHIGKVREEAYNLISEMNMQIPEFKELIIPEIAKFHHKSSKIAGFPYEQYMNLPQGTTWTCKFGNKKFEINKTCMIPEYLENTGCSDSICPICNGSYTCSRVDKFPENKRYNDKVKERLDNLDIYLDMIADSYTDEERKEFGIIH